MTSPGGNLVEIRVVAKDMTGPGFDSATKAAKGLAAAVAGGPGSAAGALKEAEKQATGLGGTLRRVGEVAGGVLAADMIQQFAQRAVQLVKSTAKAASDLGESVNAVNKTFETSSAEVIEWGEANANAFGLSQRAFNQMAVPLGAMLKNQGLQLAEVTDHTVKLTERAADMASVFNTDVTDALMAIQAGLRGEIDPLERYGVSLSAAAVEARALADSGKESAKELTNQEKALARLNLIYEQTSDTAGDFAETSDGLANAQRIATAQMEDAQAKIGSNFMPILAKAAQLTGQLAESFGSMPVPVQIAAAAVVALGAAIGLLAPKALAAKAALDAMAASDSKLQRGMARTTVAVGKAGAAFAGVTLALSGLGAAFSEELNPQIDAAVKGLGEWDRKAKLSGEAARLFGDDTKVLEMSLQQLGQGGLYKAGDQLGQFLSSIAGQDGPLGRAREHVDAFDASLAQMVRSGNVLEAQTIVMELAERTGLSIETILTILPAYAAAFETGADKTTLLGEAAEETARSVEELNDEFDVAVEQAFGFEQAQDKAAEAVMRLTEQIKQQREENVEGAGALTGMTQAAIDNRESVRGLVEIYKEMILKAQGSKEKTQALAQELEDQLTAMFGSREEAKRYVAQLFALEQQLARIKSKEIEVKVRIHEQRTFSGGGVQEFAHGGVTGAAGGGPRGNQVMVGEHGPEIVDLAPGSMVHSNGDSMRMLGQQSGGPVEVRLVFDIRGGDDDMKRMLRKWVRVDGGGDVQATFGRQG